MKIHRIPSLVLALLLQIVPVSRMALANPAVAQTAFAIVLRWVAGAGVLLGAVDAVSGASATISGLQAYQGTTKLGPLSFTPTVPAGATNITLRIIVSDPGLNPEFNFWNCTPLPPNLTLNTNVGGSGFITNVLGQATVAGVYPVTLLAGNTLFVGGFITTNATITVQTSGSTAPTITSSPPTATGTMGTAYSYTCTATGTPAPTFSVTSGSLPTGLTLSSAGVISGTPTTAGTFSGTITAANGKLPNATQGFSIVISAAPVAPTITSTAPSGTGTVGAAYGFTVTATGTPAPTFSVTSGSLPTGLTLSSAGVISGTPTTAGTFSGTITAANGTLPNATQNFSIVIGTATVKITSLAVQGTNLVLSGTGPVNGTYHVLSSTNVALPVAVWTSMGTGLIRSDGTFSFTTPADASAQQSVYLIQVP